MSKLNRKQRRQLKKLTGEKATSTIDLMLGMPTECSGCQASYDKNSKEMATTWFVDVYNSQKRVVLTCPKCRETTDNG